MPIYILKGKNAAKSGGKQAYRVVYNYTDAFGKHKSVSRTVYGKAEAKVVEREMAMQHVLSSTSMRFVELVEKYLADKKMRCRTTTYTKDARVLRGERIAGQLGDYAIEKLTVPVLEAWKESIYNSGLAPRSMHNYYSELNAVLNFAVKRDYIAKNPLQKIGDFHNAFETANDVKLHFYKAAEFAAFFRCAKEKAEKTNSLLDWGIYVFFAIAYYTGARKGEINEMRWSDLKGNVVKIRRSVSQAINGQKVVTPPKNKSSNRDVQLPAKLMRILEDQKKRQMKQKGFNDSWLICGGKDHLKDTTIENRNKEFARAAGLPHIRIHDFRHSHASVLCNAGINIKEISRRLGHSDVKMTWNTYAHLYPEEEEKAIGFLDTLDI